MTPEPKLSEDEIVLSRAQYDALRRDAGRYRYWRQHQYNGLLDVDEYCDEGSPQAIHFDRITDTAMSAAAGGGK